MASENTAGCILRNHLQESYCIFAYRNTEEGPVPGSDNSESQASKRCAQDFVWSIKPNSHITLSQRASSDNRRRQSARRLRLPPTRPRRRSRPSCRQEGKVYICRRHPDTSPSRRARQLLHERVRQLRVGPLPRRFRGMVDEKGRSKGAIKSRRQHHGCRRRRIRSGLGEQDF